MKFLFDIGGTKTRAAICEDNKILGDPVIYPTPLIFSEGLELLTRLYHELTNGQIIEVVGGGFPGVFTKEGVIVKAPNLPDWISHSLSKELQAKVNCKEIYVANDADLAGLGEACYGAGKGYDIVCYLTVSTGIGGTRIVNGKIDISIQGLEPGHQIIDANGDIFPDSAEIKEDMKVGYLENYIGGKYLKMRYGKEPEDIDDQSVWNNVERYLAVGLNNTIVHWSPQIVVIGGGITNSGKINFAKVESYLHSLLRIFPMVPEIKMCQLKDMSGLYGAMEYVNQEIRQ